jgi:hypothetical protein
MELTIPPYFGKYPQKTSCNKVPIEWRVLEKRGNETLLISYYALDFKMYHKSWRHITWENCDLRKWLNNDFLKEAFTEEEQSRIKLSDVVNDDNPWFGTKGGNITRDRIFCLSLEEAERYFKNDRDRRCWATPYAFTQTSYSFYDDGCIWWLRSPGIEPASAVHVEGGGSPDLIGERSTVDYVAVRPAMWVINHKPRTIIL